MNRDKKFEAFMQSGSPLAEEAGVLFVRFIHLETAVEILKEHQSPRFLEAMELLHFQAGRLHDQMEALQAQYEKLEKQRRKK